MYIRGVHIDDQTFFKSVKRLIVEEEPVSAYRKLIENYQVDLSRTLFNHFDPIPLNQSSTI